MENNLALYKSIIADLGRVPEDRLGEVRAWLDQVLGQVEESLAEDEKLAEPPCKPLTREEKIRQYVAEDFQRFEDTFRALA